MRLFNFESLFLMPGLRPCAPQSVETQEGETIRIVCRDRRGRLFRIGSVALTPDGLCILTNANVVHGPYGIDVEVLTSMLELEKGRWGC